MPLVIGLVVIVLFFVTGCLKGLLEDPQVKEEARGNGTGTGSARFQCPLDGAALTSMPEYRPVAVVIDNLPSARPQSGLKNADVVYETLAEGGVTRFLAVYYHGQASKVGPVRSARPYFIDLARSLKAILVHAGGSPDALEYMKDNNFPHLNEFNYSSYFWRSPDRRAPHNLYSSTDKLRSLVQKAELDREVQVEGFSFVTDDGKVGGDENIASDEIKIHFPKGYGVSYSYVPESKTYKRFIAGKSHIDETTHKQLSPRNIIVEFVKTRVVDGQGRLEMEITGHGRALVFSGGNVVEALWEHNSPDNMTTYKTMEGKSVELLPGQSWIEIVPEDTEVTF